LSLARTVKLNLPALLGEPDNTPVVEFSCKPRGREPDPSFQRYGVMPPVPVSDAKYFVPVAAAGRLAVRILKLALLTATAAVADAEGFAALTAVTVASLIVVVAGAVHNPVLEILPTLADQTTAVLLVFFTSAENCSFPPAVTDAFAGEI
jgi:hypothetical protein